MNGVPIIYIPVESKKREFDGKILLSLRLIERGFKVVLGTKSGVHREILQSHEGVYLAKSVSNEFLSFYEKLKSRKHRIAVLDVEGGALTKDIKNDLLRSYQPQASKYFDYFYVFGNKIKEAILRDLDHVKKHQVKVTGEPRFDLLRPKYEGFFQTEIEQLKKKYGIFILINTSFGLSNSSIGEENIKTFLETTSDIPDEQRHLYLKKHEEGKIVMKEFINLAKLLAETFPELNVLIRPHPDENPNKYLKQVRNIRNIYVDADGNVQPVIKSALALIHHDCTTGMEAVMAEKPVISYVPRTDDSITAWMPVYLSIKCENKKEVINEIKKILDDPTKKYSLTKEKAQLFKEYFNNYASDAAVILSDEIKKTYDKMDTKQSVFNVHLTLLRLKSLVNIVRYKYSKKNRDRFMSVSLKEIKKKIDLIDTDNITNNNLKFISYGGNTVEMSLKREQ